MKALRLLLALALVAAGIPPAMAQTAVVVSACGAASYTVGQQYPLQQLANGTLCTNATLSGTVTVGAVTQGSPATQTQANAWTMFMPQSAVVTGSITSNGDTVTITAPNGGYSSFGVQVTGTWSGAIIVQGSVDGTNFSPTTILPLSNGVPAANISANGAYQGNMAALKAIQIKGLSMVSGTANIAIYGSPTVGPVMQDNSPWQSSIVQTTPGNTNGVAIAPSSQTGVGITSVSSASAENNHVLKNAAGNLYGAYATNLTSTAGYLLILNATSAPGDGAVVPLACVALPPSGTANISRSPGPPQIYSTGITAVVSSANTCFTKTTGTITAYISGDVQ